MTFIGGSGIVSSPTQLFKEQLCLGRVRVVVGRARDWIPLLTSYLLSIVFLFHLSLLYP